MALPDLIVLGASKNDRGIQLEQLTTQLLSAVGYRVVAIRGRGAGGDEIDVSAERTFDEMGQLSTHKALCECKAFRKPADVGHWEKFLGKILLAESTSSSAVTGFF